MAVRLPDDVVAAVEEEARKQERSKSAVVVRALRQAFGINTLVVANPPMHPGKTMVLKELDVEPEKILEKPKRETGMCGHGREVKFCVQCQVTTKKGLNG